MERLNTVVNKLSELEVVKNHKYGTIIIQDDEGDPLGISIVDLEGETSEEIIWIEDRDNKGITIEVNPDVSDEDPDVQEFWTVLYCVTAIMKELDKDMWGEFGVTELAEMIYEKRKKGFMQLGEFTTEEVKEETSKKPESEALHTVDIDLESLVDLILAHDTEEEVETLTNFINALADLNGWSFGLDILDDTDLETEYTDEGEVLQDEFRDSVGILNPMYTINNLSTMMNEELLKTEKDNKDVLMFLNQLINERVRIEELIRRIIE